MEKKFGEFSEFRESDNFTEAQIRVNLKIMYLTCVLLALW